jgi:hypothetical protein
MGWETRMKNMKADNDTYEAEPAESSAVEVEEAKDKGGSGAWPTRWAGSTINQTYTSK